MGTHDQLLKLYDDLLPDDLDGMIPLYVVPMIRHDYKQSDYLYLLYQDILENHQEQFDLKSISVWKHWVFVWKAITTNRVILHYHWLECTDVKSLAGMIYKLFCIYLFKAAGGHLVWTIHNKMPHVDKFQLINNRIQSWMATRADLLHIHCKSVIEDISRFYNQPESKFRVVDHPTFPSKKITREKAIIRLNSKRSLSLDKADLIFLMFGNISSYKQIDKVCRIFSDLPSNRKLLIVGPVKKGQMSNFREIKRIAETTENIRLVPHFISEDMVPHYMNAADCVVFNYREILTSGGVELARSYDRPILAPDMGCLSELDEENVTLFNSQQELKQLLETFEPNTDMDA